MPPIKINNIYGGISPTYNTGNESTYLASVAIDPDDPVASAIKRVSGAINPVTHAKFSGSEMTGFPLWIKPNTKTTNTMVYASDGKFHSYDSSLAMRATDEASTSLPISISNASGNGLAYYNNYYYVVKDTDIDRYGPMNGGANIALSSNWWTSLVSRVPVLSILINQTSQNANEPNGIESLAQSINESTAISFNAIEILMSNNGATPTYTIEVSIQTDNSDSPSGTVYQSSTVTKAGTDLPTGDQPVLFEFGKTITLEAGTKYWVVITTSSALGTNQGFRVGRSSNTDPYENGHAKKYNGSAWSAVSGNEDLNLVLLQYTRPYKALVNTTYPTIGNTKLPNHTAHVHTDNSVYVADYQGNRGLIHKINTGDVLKVQLDAIQGVFEVGDIITGETSNASGTIASIGPGFTNNSTTYNVEFTLVGVSGTFQDAETINGLIKGVAVVDEVLEQGAGNYQSQFNVLDLPAGYYPTAIESYGTDLAITAIRTTDTSLNQGNAAMFLWDTIDVSFYAQIELPFPFATAMQYDNGRLFIYGGNGKNGYQCAQYIGGRTIEKIVYVDDGVPPFAGAVTAEMGRIVWGSQQEYPSSQGCVLAFGSRSANVGVGLHNIAHANSSGDTPQVTALAYSTQTDNDTPRQLVIGWGTSTAKGLDKPSSSATISSSIRWAFQVGQKFSISRIIIPLQTAVAANMSCTPKLYVDNATSATTTLREINSTNYPNSEKIIVYEEFDIGTDGQQNFIFELNFAGTVKLPVNFPITIEVSPEKT